MASLEPPRLALKSAAASVGRTWMLSCLAIVFVAVVWLWKDYQTTVELASVQLSNVARLLETHTSHVITNADMILDRVVDEIRDHDIMDKGADKRWPALGAIATRLPVSGRLWLYRADGTAVMASHLRHSSNNASDREYFNAHKMPGLGLFIGETVLGKTTGKKVFNLSRRVDAPDGAFGGVIMAAIDIDVFIAAVSELKLGQSAAYALVRNDGAVIMRYPDAGATGKRFNLKSQAEIAKTPVGMISTVSSIDGLERLLGYRKHPQLPLTVVVSLSRDEVLASWRHRALTLGGGLVLLLVLATYLSVLAQKAARREIRAVARMQKVLDTVGEGICGLDVSGSIAFINPAGARLLGGLPGEWVGQDFQATAQRPNDPDRQGFDAAASFKKIALQGGEQQGQAQFVSKNGGPFMAEYTATCVDDLDGKPGVVLAFRDVSVAVAAQHALRDQKQFVTAILDSLSEHIAVINPQGVITAVNSIWRNFALANGAQVTTHIAEGTNYLETVAKAAATASSKDAAEALRGIRAVLAGELSEFSQEYPCHSPEHERWFLQHALPLRGAQAGAVIIHQNVTERHNAETRLRESEARYRLLADNANDVIWLMDLATLGMTYVSPSSKQLTGFDAEVSASQTLDLAYTPESCKLLRETVKTFVERNGAGDQPSFSDALELDMRHRLGHIVHVETKLRFICDAGGQPTTLLGVARDITARKQQEMRLKASEEHFRILAENMADIVWKADRRLCFTYINAADQRLRGFTRDEVIGHSIMETLTEGGQSILAQVMRQRQALEEGAQSGQALRFEIPQRCRDGGQVWTEITTMPVYDANGQIDGYQGIGRDVSARKRDEAQRRLEQHQLEVQLVQAAERQVSLQDQANRDPLTGIYNRRYFNEMLPYEFDNAQRVGYPLVVVMLDLDHFKNVNDTHGHAAGDEVLKALAALLKNRARETDIICRYGGEEFVVIMTRMSVERAWQRIESWRCEIADRQIQWGQTVIQVTFSAGMTEFPAHGADMETLLKRADEMLYRAKAQGRNCVMAYAAESSPNTHGGLTTGQKTVTSDSAP